VRKQLGFPGAYRALIMAVSAAVAPMPAVAVPTIAVHQGPASAEQPALWVLSDADTTIYLFGTFHALDERTDWFARNVRAAFDSSDELVLETLVPTDPAELHGVLARHALAAPVAAGAPVIGGGRASSFVASAGQAVAAGRSAGLSVDRGADAVLRRIAMSQGKPVDGLESFDFQLSMFAGLPAPAPTAAPQRDARQMILDMRSAWRRGDASSFATVLGNLEAQSPATYKTLFVDRNSDWARWIADRMQRPGTVFVAVGTGHLIGRDSVQQKLASRGLRAMRIN
jgi:uncharacterized protein YbaP (TraB family)